MRSEQLRQSGMVCGAFRGIRTLFPLIEVAGAIGKRSLARYGVGRLVNSASTTAAATILAANGESAAYMAGLATVPASIASALSNVRILRRVTGAHGVPFSRRDSQNGGI
jgi:hypothetical protein